MVACSIIRGCLHVCLGLLVHACCVVHNFGFMLVLPVHMLVLAFYCLHVNVNVTVLVCLLFLCVLIYVCLLVHACLCVQGLECGIDNIMQP